MFWQVIIPGENDEQLSKSITVEAENWFSALRDGLDKYGVDGKLLSNLSCNINQDQSVVVTDFVTRRIYTLRPVDESGGEPSSVAEEQRPSAPAEDSREETEKQEESAAPKAEAGEMPAHEVFFSRDESPDDGSGICYRERLIAVEPGFPLEAASDLAQRYFRQLKKLGSPEGTKLFITVHIFDHVFETRSERPAVAALTWREWSPKKPRILFPLSGEEGITFSKLSAPPAKVVQPAPERESHPAQGDAPEALKLDTGRISQVEVRRSRSSVVTKPRMSSLPPRRGSRISRPPTPPPGSPGWDASIEEKMIQAFERMQDIYDVREHDEAASFVLCLTMDLVQCESGSCMLISPGKYELYVAAARGPVADSLVGKKLSLTKGIVGFATRNSAVISVSDPENDPRFHEDIDIQSGYKTNNVLCAPVQYEGLTIGAIELINTPRKDGFDQGDANILSYLGSALAEYISTSLPSREADFSDRDFLDPEELKRAEAKKKGLGARTAATKKTAGRQSNSINPPPRSSRPSSTGSKTQPKAKAKAKKKKKKKRK